jgi:catechol 2,3-dioxygenase-like lactoylglutathione lyase family enzyme
MIRGALSHLDLTITDPARSVPFYDAVLSLLGYRRASVGVDTTASACWAITDQEHSVFSIGLEPAHGPGKQQPHDRYAPGLHHVAFHVDSRADVDHLYTQLVAMGADILEPPAEYAYTPGYYAVSCRDPDGLVLEFVYEPQQRGLV